MAVWGWYLQWRGSNANRFPFEVPYFEKRRGAGSTMLRTDNR